MENNNWNNNMYLVIIIVLLVIIAIWSFFIWKNYNNVFVENNNNQVNNTTNNEKSDLKFFVIDDIRCTNCQTDGIINQLKQIPVLWAIDIEKKDFSDEWMEKYIKENNITTLPVFIFNSNNIDTNINQYLQVLPSWEYSLQIGANFDPFAKRSEKWFLLLEKEKLNEIKEILTLNEIWMLK